MKNKRKGIILAASILGTLAIVSTGFAAWTIIQNGTDTAEGSIEVDTVQDQRHVVKAGEISGEIFIGGKDSGDNAEYTNAWLKTDATKSASLSVNFNVEVSNYSSAKLKVDLEVSTDNGTSYKSIEEDAKWAKVFENKLLTYDFTGKGNSDGMTLAAESTNITLEFKWGAHFSDTPSGTGEGENPIKFYNTKTVEGSLTDGYATNGTDKTWGDDALTQLKLLEDVKDTKFKFTLTAVHVG